MMITDYKNIVLKDISVDDIFSLVKLGIDEQLYIDSVGINDMVLVNDRGDSIKVTYPSDDKEYTVNGIISCCGTLMLSVEDLFFLEIDNILSYTPIKDQKFKELNNSNEILRSDIHVKRWRDKVINRDKVCQCCGGDKHLEAHHIFSWEDYPSLRVDIENGITLCRFCHYKYNSYFGHKGTGNNMVKFLKKFG